MYEVLKAEVGKPLADYIAKGFEWKIFPALRAKPPNIN
jgi:hypothetical protein